MIFPHIEASRCRLRLVSRTRSVQRVHALLSEIDGGPAHGFEVLEELMPAVSRAYAAQFVIEAPEDASPVGFGALHALNLIDQNVRATLLGGPHEDDRMREAGALMVNYAFSTWPLRKISFWTPEETVPYLAEGPVPPRHEGTLTNYLSTSDGLQDMHVHAVHRRDWIPDGVDHVESLVNGGRV